ncbi:uncharacterized protein LOC143738104 isoform X1 [Siphateles boraxobius]|uniref:uncharacterized protein LOC143738104 isoform X1 n=2 Tax=Siphateles boraxobius TaxID=180520 RepID=UPI004064881E
MYLHFNLLKRITIFFFYEQDWKESCGGSRFPLLDFWRSATDSREETEPFKESPMVTECFRETPQTAATAETSAKTQIEVIKGSGVFCQALPPLLLPWCGICCWAPFDLETLLKSNLNGGKPTRGDGEQLVALDQIKKAAIIDATLKKWPTAS